MCSHMRLAVPEDLDEISEIIQNIISCPDKDLINQWDEEYPTREVFARNIRNGSLYVYIYDGNLENKRNGRVGGMFVLAEDLDYKDNAEWIFPGPFLVIHRFCVSPDLHGRGVAKTMLGYIDAIAAQNGYAALRLDTYSKNSRSNHLYASKGYRYAGEIRGRMGIYNCYEKEVRVN